MAGFYNAEALAADRLFESSVAFERGLDLIDEMGRLNHDSVVRNGDLADDLVIHGREVARMMREFALIVDRSVASRH